MATIPPPGYSRQEATERDRGSPRLASAAPVEASPFIAGPGSPHRGAQYYVSPGSPRRTPYQAGPGSPGRSFTLGGSSPSQSQGSIFQGSTRGTYQQVSPSSGGSGGGFQGTSISPPGSAGGGVTSKEIMYQGSQSPGRNVSTSGGSGGPYPPGSPSQQRGGVGGGAGSVGGGYPLAPPSPGRSLLSPQGTPTSSSVGRGRHVIVPHLAQSGSPRASPSSQSDSPQSADRGFSGGGLDQNQYQYPTSTLSPHQSYLQGRPGYSNPSALAPASPQRSPQGLSPGGDMSSRTSFNPAAQHQAASNSSHSGSEIVSNIPFTSSPFKPRSPSPRTALSAGKMFQKASSYESARLKVLDSTSPRDNNYVIKESPQGRPGLNGGTSERVDELTGAAGSDGGEVRAGSGPLLGDKPSVNAVIKLAPPSPRSPSTPDRKPFLSPQGGGPPKSPTRSLTPAAAGSPYLSRSSVLKGDRGSTGATPGSIPSAPIFSQTGPGSVSGSLGGAKEGAPGPTAATSADATGQSLAADSEYQPKVRDLIGSFNMREGPRSTPVKPKSAQELKKKSNAFVDWVTKGGAAAPLGREKASGDARQEIEQMLARMQILEAELEQAHYEVANLKAHQNELHAKLDASEESRRAAEHARGAAVAQLDGVRKEAEGKMTNMQAMLASATALHAQSLELIDGLKASRAEAQAAADAAAQDVTARNKELRAEVDALRGGHAAAMEELSNMKAAAEHMVPREEVERQAAEARAVTERVKQEVQTLGLKLEAVVKARDQAEKSKAGVLKEKEALLKEKVLAEREKEMLLKEKASLTKSKAELERAKGELAQAKAAAELALEKTSAEAKVQIDAISQRAEDLRKSGEDLQASREELRREKEEVAAQCAKLGSQLAAAETAAAAAQAEAQALKGDLESADQRKAATSAEAAGVNAALQAATAEIASLEKRVESASKEIETARLKAERSEREAEVARDDMKGLVRRLEEEARARESAAKEREALLAELAEKAAMASERDALRSENAALAGQVGAASVAAVAAREERESVVVGLEEKLRESERERESLGKRAEGLTATLSAANAEALKAGQEAVALREDVARAGAELAAAHAELAGVKEKLEDARVGLEGATIRVETMRKKAEEAGERRERAERELEDVKVDLTAAEVARNNAQAETQIARAEVATAQHRAEIMESAAAEAEEETRQARANEDAASRQVAALQAELERMGAEMDGVSQQAAAALAGLQTDVELLKSQLAQAEASLATAESRHMAAVKSMEAARAAEAVALAQVAELRRATSAALPSSSKTHSRTISLDSIPAMPAAIAGTGALEHVEEAGTSPSPRHGGAISPVSLSPTPAVKSPHQPPPPGADSAAAVPTGNPAAPAGTAAAAAAAAAESEAAARDLQEQVGSLRRQVSSANEVAEARLAAALADVEAARAAEQESVKRAQALAKEAQGAREREAAARAYVDKVRANEEEAGRRAEVASGEILLAKAEAKALKKAQEDLLWKVNALEGAREVLEGELHKWREEAVVRRKSAEALAKRQQDKQLALEKARLEKAAAEAEERREAEAAELAEQERIQLALTRRAAETEKQKPGGGKASGVRKSSGSTTPSGDEPKQKGKKLRAESAKWLFGGGGSKAQKSSGRSLSHSQLAWSSPLADSNTSSANGSPLGSTSGSPIKPKGPLKSFFSTGRGSDSHPSPPGSGRSSQADSPMQVEEEGVHGSARGSPLAVANSREPAAHDKESKPAGERVSPGEAAGPHGLGRRQLSMEMEQVAEADEAREGEAAPEAGAHPDPRGAGEAAGLRSEDMLSDGKRIDGQEESVTPEAEHRIGGGKDVKTAPGGAVGVPVGGPVEGPVGGNERKLPQQAQGAKGGTSLQEQEQGQEEEPSNGKRLPLSLGNVNVKADEDGGEKIVQVVDETGPDGRELSKRRGALKEPPNMPKCGCVVQ